MFLVRFLFFFQFISDVQGQDSFWSSSNFNYLWIWISTKVSSCSDSWNKSNFNIKTWVSNFIHVYMIDLFERGASEVARGCLMSVAAKVVKTAKEIPFDVLALWNKWGRHVLVHINARGNKSGLQIWDTFWHIMARSLFSPIHEREINWAGRFGTLF